MTPPSHHIPLFLALWGSLAGGCDRPDDVATPTVPTPEDADRLQPVEVHQPAALTGLKSALRDHQGRPVMVACSTCHSLRQAALPEHVEALGPVHRGMKVSHGGLRCAACHNPARGDRLRLADGRQLPLAEAFQLCSQCHGPQARDWTNGSHGGMRGHWDRRGPAQRNHCIDCHDAHSPQFPSFRPAPPPRDRFLSAAGGHDG